MYKVITTDEIAAQIKFVPAVWVAYDLRLGSTTMSVFVHNQPVARKHTRWAHAGSFQWLDGSYGEACGMIIG